MPGEARIEAAHHRDRGHQRGVARTAGENDVGTSAQRLHERLGAHHRDDAMRLGQDGLVDLGCRFEREDAAIAELADQHVAIDFGGYERRGEVQLLLGGDLLDDLPHPVEVPVAAAAAARADQQRDVEPTRRTQQNPQVALDGIAREEGKVFPEVVRPTVGRAGVDGDEVEPLAEGHLEVLLGESTAEHPDGDEVRDRITHR